MIKYIKRKTDGKYLQSLENDTWTDDIKDAFEMTYRECENAKESLLNSYSSDDIKEILNMSKSKPITKEEKKELIDLLRNK
jgi:hypothetical protein